MKQPRLLITLGDVAGVGPEILVKSWALLLEHCLPIVIGDPDWLRRAMELVHFRGELVAIREPDEARPAPERICILSTGRGDLKDVTPGRVSAAAGRAAYDFLVDAIDRTRAGQADGIVTLPLHKEGLAAARLHYPGHTEILAERTGTRRYGMMLYARGPQIPHGLGVVHVTLHMALRDVFGHLNAAAIVEKIHLLDNVMTRLCGHKPRLAVAALNPHAGDGGLFGDEEERLIKPAIVEGRGAGLDVSGPLPADTLFVQAQRGAFDGVVAMYHDQGHIALKLLSGLRAVNVTLGLPFVRTSVAHGTAYDIAWKGVADHGSLVEAVRVAALLTPFEIGH